MAKKVVNVLRGHINRGIRRSAIRCPVALALRELLAPQWRAFVDLGLMSIEKFDAPPCMEYKLYMIKMPMEVTEWIRVYDCGKAAEPVFFTIEIPDECLL